MPEDHLLNIKPFMQIAVWTPRWISNGHFAVLKERVKLGVHLTSKDALICAFPKAVVNEPWEDEKMVGNLTTFTGLRVEFTRSPWCHKNAALFLDASGNAAWFNADYCDALRIQTLYGPAAMFAAKEEISAPYFDGPTFDESTIAIMPMTVPVDWDQVARTVAAASIEDATAATFADMPQAEPESAPVSEPQESPQMDLAPVTTE